MSIEESQNRLRILGHNGTARQVGDDYFVELRPRAPAAMPSNYTSFFAVINALLVKLYCSFAVAASDYFLIIVNVFQ